MEFEILIVDDVIADAQAAANILSELAGVKTFILDDPNKALLLIEREPKRFALALVDFNFNLKNLDGVVLAKKIWQINPQQLVAIFSGESNQASPIKCIGTPIVEFIVKGSPATQMQKKVQNLLQKYAATQRPHEVSKVVIENQQLCANIGAVSKSAKMAELSKSVVKVATKDGATVLLRGESGTGKELIARSIHELSPRKNQPFVAINMGAFQPNLIESELFGHERGAFTGASHDRKGAFAQAHGGTIFLDEIGELSLDLQVKLLRVLQEREVQPVGATKPIKIDVRVITATHVNLEDQIKSGKFRFDLFQRLNVVTLNLPTLRDRKDDIEVLAPHFLKKYKSLKTFHPSTLIQMEKYSWPGNIRELENVIQKLDILTDDEVIMPVHLPSEIFAAQEEASSLASVDLTMEHAAFAELLFNLEREYFIYHLSQAKSVRDAAKNRLHMAPTTLTDKMKLFNITFKSKAPDLTNFEAQEETDDQTNQ